MSPLFSRRAQGPLTRRGHLPSELWLDQPGAHREIEGRLALETLTPDEAEKLHKWVDDGYLTLSIDVDAGVYADIDATVERLWREKPSSVVYAYQGPLKVFAAGDEERERRPSYRIADLHSVSSGALALYLQPQIFHYVELVFGCKAVATQSLYFEYGSQQALHRDPVYVHTSPANHLLASWTALEDIGPECGPLCYVPGSHRLPYYPLRKRDHRLRVGHDEARLPAAQEFDRRECRKRGLEERVFTCARGEVLVWHTSLLHGGSKPRDPTQTRKSFVTHYTTLGNYHHRRQTFVERVTEGGGEPIERTRAVGTSHVLTQDGCHGFASPLAAHD